MLVKQLGLWAAAVVLAACALPSNLNEDGYNAKKYDLPPVLHDDASKTISVTDGEGWAFIPVKQGNYYEVSATGSTSATLTIYHADKTTAYATVASGTGLGFFASTSENVFVKIVEGSASTSCTVRCASYPVLTSGVWQNGSIKEASDGSAAPLWYVIPVVANTSYDFSLNNNYEGDGSKSGLESVRVYGSDRTTALGSSFNEAYNSPMSLVSSQSGVAFVQVYQPWDWSGGSFAVRFQQTGAPAQLTSGVWFTDTVSNNSYRWYSFPVTAGQFYDVNLNQRYDGDGSKTASISGGIYHADKISSYTSSGSIEYASAGSFLATATETVFVKVTDGSYAGSFAVRIQPTPVTALSPGVWKSDTMPGYGSGWYSFPVTAGTLYDFNMNNGYSGDGTMPAHTTASIYHADRSTPYPSSMSSAYSSAYTFLATASETLFVKIVNNSTPGAFAIRMQPTPMAALASGVWKNDTITNGGTLWYTFSVVAGTLYDIRMNTSGTGSGDGTKTASTQAMITSPDLATTYLSGAVQNYSYPTNFVASATGTVFVKITNYFSSTGGTFGLLLEATPVTVLTSGVWQSDTITAPGELWYSFTAAGSTQYHLRTNDAWSGDGSKTSFALTRIYPYNLSAIYPSSVGQYIAPGYPFTPPAGTVYICVSTSGYSGGTFAVEYQ